MKKFTLASFDLVLFGAAFVLLVIGILFIYSSGINVNGVQVLRGVHPPDRLGGDRARRCMVFFAFFSYTTLRMFSLYIYAGGLFLLLLTLADRARR